MGRILCLIVLTVVAFVCVCVCFKWSKCFSTKSLSENSECLVWVMLQQAALEHPNPVLCVFSLWGSLWVEVVELAHKNIWCGREEPVSLINWWLCLYSTVLFSVLEWAHCAFGHMWFWRIDQHFEYPLKWCTYSTFGLLCGWCRVKLLPSQHVLCTPYNHAPCHVTLCKAHT